MDIVSIGEALIDFKAEGSDPLGFQGYVGGSPLNVAVAAARLAEGPVGFISQVSEDMFGERIVAHLRENDVATDLLLRSDAPSTLAFVSERGGDAHFSFIGEGAADTRYDPRPRPDLPAATRFLMFGSISLLREPSASAIADVVAKHAERLTVLFDPNVRPVLIPDRGAYLEKLDGWLELADIVKVSRQDLDWLHPDRDPEDVARDWLQRGPRAAIVTDGDHGVRLLRVAGETVSVPTPEVDVVDTVGAGDTFSGSLMTTLSERDAPLDEMEAAEAEAALRFAAGAAALNCTRAGADPPRRDELDAFLAERS